jgi:hypothetical protein
VYRWREDKAPYILNLGDWFEVSGQLHTSIPNILEAGRAAQPVRTEHCLPPTRTGLNHFTNKVR